MCGLIFLYADRIDNPDARIAKSLRHLRHRGPDAQRQWCVGRAHLAHARLSIVDLEHSQQPMLSPDGRYALVYNGEIYNYRALRSALAARWTFQTTGDTEVLLAGLIQEGESFLNRLEGMWAFALWDTQAKTLLLSRDRLGKKPLYYFLAREGFACASELPALRYLAASSWAQDPDSIADYFRYGYCLPGYTAWQGVLEVLPGHWLKWRPGMQLVQKAYWQLPLPNEDSTFGSDEELEQLLVDAVGKRLVADVEVGGFLSGGIDSSLVCALAQRQMDRKLKTFTIGFREAAYDESAYAEKVAAFLGTDHRCEVFSGWDESDLEILLRDHVGQPFADSSLLPTAMVSRVASNAVKVVLTGDGADELFGGYQRYQARLLLRWYSRIPMGMRKVAEKAIRRLPEPTVHHSRSLLKKANLFLDIERRGQAETPYVAPLNFHPREFSLLFPELTGHGHKPPGLPEQTEMEDLQRMLISDALIYLPQDILAKLDRASMSVGLEARAPFLDHKVVETAFYRPAKSHLKLGSGKQSLRRVFATMLPKEVWRRRKQGFGVPIHAWFRGHLGDRFQERLGKDQGAVNELRARALLEQHQSGKRDNGQRLWLLYAYLCFSDPDSVKRV